MVVLDGSSIRYYGASDSGMGVVVVVQMRVLWVVVIRIRLVVVVSIVSGGGHRCSSRDGDYVGSCGGVSGDR